MIRSLTTATTQGTVKRFAARAAVAGVLATTATLGAQTSAQAYPAPNDNIRNAESVFGHFSQTAGDNVDATKQRGERRHVSTSPSQPHSVWYKWRAPAGCWDARIDTLDHPNFDTLLAVYTSPNPRRPHVTNLYRVANNDDAAPGVLQSKVNFPSSPRQTYFIAVDGFAGAEGDFVLTTDCV
jgi:hypothetical protein